jgi:hypothetical protein
VTFKDLKKRLCLETTTNQQDRLFDRLENKAFWIWNIQEHKQQDVKTEGDCCFNHMIGLPTKEGIEKPIFDYQNILYDALLNVSTVNALNYDFKFKFKDKHLWVKKKATGLGVIEFFLRLMVWLCLKDDTYHTAQMCIVTGPNQDIAIKLIKRIIVNINHMVRPLKVDRDSLAMRISLSTKKLLQDLKAKGTR